MADAWTKGREFIEAVCEHLKVLDATVHELNERIKKLEAKPVYVPSPNINDLPTDY